MKIFFNITLILLILSLGEVSAKKPWDRRTGTISPWEFGLSGGVSTFITTINPDMDATENKINYWDNDLNPGIGLSVVRNFSPSLGIEVNWLNTRLSGTWSDKYPPLPVSATYDSPLTFDSRINQFDLMMAFNVNQIFLPGDDEDLWHLFFKTGMGIAHINDKRNFFPGDSPSNELSFVLDAGISVSLNEKIKLMAGSSFRFADTDNLDGVHVTGSDINGNTISNMNVFEIYNFTYLRISYSLGDFGKKNGSCPF